MATLAISAAKVPRLLSILTLPKMRLTARSSRGSTLVSGVKEGPKDATEIIKVYGLGKKVKRLYKAWCDSSCKNFRSTTLYITRDLYI